MQGGSLICLACAKRNLNAPLAARERGLGPRTRTRVHGSVHARSLASPPACFSQVRVLGNTNERNVTEQAVEACAAEAWAETREREGTQGKRKERETIDTPKVPAARQLLWLCFSLITFFVQTRQACASSCVSGVSNLPDLSSVPLAAPCMRARMDSCPMGLGRHPCRWHSRGNCMYTGLKKLCLLCQ